MRAMESANAEMDDAYLLCRAIISGPGHLLRHGVDAVR